MASDIQARLNNEIITTHDDIVRLTSEKVLEQSIPWEGYHRANLISERELDLIRKFDKKSNEVRQSLITKEGEIYAELFLELLVKINKEETLQYLLTLIDNLLSKNSECVSLFLKLSSKNPNFPFEPFVRLLNRSNLDWYTNSKASSVLATVLCNAPSVTEENGKFMCHWIRSQLAKPDERDICNAITALQKILLRDDFRGPFAEEDGLRILASLLKSKIKNFQIQYQILYSFWLLSYSEKVANLTGETNSIIGSVVEILRTVSKEKVVRMCLATLRNLLNHGNNNEQMIDANIMKPLENLAAKNWKDEDITDDLDSLQESLHKSIVVLSTFDMYKKQVLSGKLDWSPVHRSEKFWRENAPRFEEDKCKLLLVLKDILTTSKDPLILSVACFDVGEFARFHPRGKVIVQQLSLKMALMQLMEDKDMEVKKHALLAIQKLMVTNWEYLTH